MTLADLIRKRKPGKPATAIPANAATQQGEAAGTVARIATIAVANPQGAQGGAHSRGRLVGYPEGQQVEVYVLPEPTRAEVLRDCPGAITAEPIPETPKRIPTASMTADEETLIRAWLAHIEETDPAIIAEVLDKCRTDSDAREYFVRRAKEVRR